MPVIYGCHLPKTQARAEAKWLADTAVVQSAAIARNNRIVLFGWLNNILVNSNLRDRYKTGMKVL